MDYNVSRPMRLPERQRGNGDKVTAIPGEAKSPGNKGLRRMCFRETYAFPATGAYKARSAIDLCFHGVFLNCLVVAFVQNYLNTLGIDKVTALVFIYQIPYNAAQMEHVRSSSRACATGEAWSPPPNFH